MAVVRFPQMKQRKAFWARTITKHQISKPFETEDDDWCRNRQPRGQLTASETDISNKIRQWSFPIESAVKRRRREGMRGRSEGTRGNERGREGGVRGTSNRRFNIPRINTASFPPFRTKTRTNVEATDESVALQRNTVMLFDFTMKPVRSGLEGIARIGNTHKIVNFPSQDELGKEFI